MKERIYDYLREGKLSTSSRFLYKRILKHFGPIVELNADGNGNHSDSLRQAFQALLVELPKQNPAIKTLKYCNLLCGARRIMNYLRLNPTASCFTDQSELRETLLCMASDRDGLETGETVFNSAALLFSPNYQSSTSYLLNVSNKNRIYQVISEIIGPEFDYMALYDIDCLLALHRKFLELFLAEEQIAQYTWPQITRKISVYTYIDLFKATKESEEDFLLTDIEEVFFIPNMEQIHLHVEDEIALQNYLPYLQHLKEVSVTFVHSRERCGCGAKETSCAIKYADPAKELRKRAFSIGDLTKLLKNPSGFYLEGVLGIKQCGLTQNHFTGVIAHSVLEECLSVDIKKIEDLHAVVELILAKYTLSKVDRWSLLVKLRQIIEHLWPFIELSEGVYCEVEGKQSFLKDGEIYYLHGRADFIYKERKTGRYGVIDFKTGFIPSWLKIARGQCPQVPLEIFLLASGSFIQTEDIKLADCGLLSPKGFFKVDSSEKSISFIIQGINALIQAYWIEKRPYYELVSSKYPIFSRAWEEDA